MWCQEPSTFHSCPPDNIAHNLDERMCKALPGFHALTGCDFISSLAGIGKKKAWGTLTRSVIHKESLFLLGEQQEISVTAVTKWEEFICNLYPSPRKTSNNIDELRYLLFCHKKQKTEMLPPTSNALLQHVKRAKYQTHVWKCSLEAQQVFDVPENHGWERWRFAATIDD